MRTLAVAALCLLVATLAAVTAAAEPPQPGGHCDVQEEYVTEASLGRDPDGPTSLPTVQPGAARPIECYY